MFVHRGGQAIEVSSHAARRMTQRGISIDAVESSATRPSSTSTKGLEDRLLRPDGPDVRWNRGRHRHDRHTQCQPELHPEFAGGGYLNGERLVGVRRSSAPDPLPGY
jgi:hypothetical protein